MFDGRFSAQNPRTHPRIILKGFWGHQIFTSNNRLSTFFLVSFCGRKPADISMSVSNDTVTALLLRLSLERYLPLLNEEDLTQLPVLRAIGADKLRENLVEIGFEPADASTLAAELFPEDCVDERAPELEENIAVAPSAPPPPAVSAAHPNLASADETAFSRSQSQSVTDSVPPIEESEEEDAVAARDVDWLLKPMLPELELPQLKRELLTLTATAHRHMRAREFANACAAYSRAISLDAPNGRAIAALYYNRAACHMALGHPHAALTDAQLAAKAHGEPTRAAAAWWRAADAALELGDSESARDAVKAGLRARPGCAQLEHMAARWPELLSS